MMDYLNAKYYDAEKTEYPVYNDVVDEMRELYLCNEI